MCARSARQPPEPVVVDKFGGSVLRQPEDIAAAVAAVAEQRAAGLRPVVVVSAFEGVTDAILGSAAVLLPDRGAALREASHEPDSAFAREADRALATGEPSLSLPCFAERRYGGVPDEEMLMALPLRYLPIAIEGMKALSANGLRYPIAPYGIQNDVRAGMGVSYAQAPRAQG